MGASETGERSEFSDEKHGECENVRVSGVSGLPTSCEEGSDVYSHESVWYHSAVTISVIEPPWKRGSRRQRRKGN